MQSKVLQGEAQGGLSALARRQEEVLRSQQQQLQQQRSQDAAKLRRIVDMEEAALMAQGKYSSLQARACYALLSCHAMLLCHACCTMLCCCRVMLLLSPAVVSCCWVLLLISWLVGAR